MIGWLLRRWQRRYPTAVFAGSMAILLAGLVVLVVWLWRDLSKGMLVRPAIAVLALALLSMRVIMSFKPHRR